MRKSILKITALVILITVISFGAFSQNFEGSIEFKKETMADTTTYIYFVKGNNVKIDEIGSRSHRVEGTFLIDLEAKTMKSLNHDRKLYMEQTTPSTPPMKGTCTVKKGTATKTLQGYKCTEYLVTNTEEETIITYYLADGKFSFFQKLLHILNRREKPSIYFLQIQDVNNMFPMMSFSTDLKGKENGRLEVTKITSKIVDPSMFEIPKGYVKFEK